MGILERSTANAIQMPEAINENLSNLNLDKNKVLSAPW